MAMILAIISAIIAVTTALIFLIKWNQSYWYRKGLSTPPTTFFFGSCTKVFTQKQSFGDFTQELYDYFKTKNKAHGGFYFSLMPTYMPVDPKIIKHIMQNDFDHFFDRGIYYNEEIDPLSAHLFAMDGIKWKNLRVKLSPTFTSGKMKMMFDTLVKCGDQLIEEMEKNVGVVPMNTKNILERFTTDIIANCAFGINCNSLKNPDNEYIEKLRLFFVKGFWDNIASIITFVAPEVARKFSLPAINPILSNFFLKVINDTVQYREKNNVYRKDFMHLLLQLKNRGKLSDDNNIILNEKSTEKEVTLSMNELAAQAFVFFAAGFETSSTAMTFCLLELALNNEIQEKLRREISEVLEKYDNDITYDALMEMQYMEQVINETLRKYPPLPGLNRICTKDYKVPDTDFILEKGTKVWIPVLGLQRDPEYYPDPEKFDPERFSEENKRLRPPYTFLPFGEGPRICIGLRFGMMQTKVGLCVLLKNYKFSVNRKTSLPLKLDPASFIMTTKGGIWLNYNKV